MSEELDIYVPDEPEELAVVLDRKSFAWQRLSDEWHSVTDHRVLIWRELIVQRGPLRVLPTDDQSTRMTPPVDYGQSLVIRPVDDVDTWNFDVVMDKHGSVWQRRLDNGLWYSAMSWLAPTNDEQLETNYGPLIELSPIPPHHLPEEVVMLLRQVIAARAFNQWASKPMALLDGKSPYEAIESGHTDDVIELVKTYIDPNFA